MATQDSGNGPTEYVINIMMSGSTVGKMKEAGFAPLDGEAAIIPIIVGETSRAIELSQRLLDHGVFVTGFGYPVVPEGTARIRVQMSAALEPVHLERALEAFVEVGREAGLVAA